MRKEITREVLDEMVALARDLSPAALLRACADAGIDPDVCSTHASLAGNVVKRANLGEHDALRAWILHVTFLVKQGGVREQVEAACRLYRRFQDDLGLPPCKDGD